MINATQLGLPIQQLDWILNIWSHECCSHLSEIDGKLSGYLHLSYCIIYLDDIIFSKHL